MPSSYSEVHALFQEVFESFERTHALNSQTPRLCNVSENFSETEDSRDRLEFVTESPSHGLAEKQS